MQLGWGGFLIDLNVRDVVPLLKRARLTAFADDSDTVHEAWEQGRTIVTVNERDFVRYMLEHSKRDSGRECQDGFGLLIVPDSSEARKRLIPRVANGVDAAGGRIPWPVIGYANICVTLHVDGSLGLRRFKRCVHCDRQNPIDEDWYKRLPSIRGPQKSGRRVNSNLDERSTKG